MKRKLTGLGIIILALMSFIAEAQNYQPFRKGPTYHYVAQNSIYSLRIDTAKVVAGDSVFVFNPTAIPIPNFYTTAGCPGPLMISIYKTYQNNQFGRQVLKQANGDYIFRTWQGQNFLLKTKAGIGQTWTFFQGSNITATLVAKTFEPVATTSDSVLIYALSDGKHIKLTKNYGFLTAPNFAAYADPIYNPRILQFHALPEKGLGTAISAAFTIFDFNPGDKFTYFKDWYSTLRYVALCQEEWINYEVLSKQVSAGSDTISYRMERESFEKRYGNPPPHSYCYQANSSIHHPKTIETWIVTASNYPDINLLTNGYRAEASTLVKSSVNEGIFATTVFNQRPGLKIRNTIYNICHQAFFNPSWHADGNTHYGAGLGKTYFNWQNVGGHGSEALIAYVKGTETFGRWQSVAQLLSTKEDLNSKQMVTAFPNPFASEITLTFGETSGNMQLTLFNTLGQKVWEKETTATANADLKMNLPALAKGMYLLQAAQNGKTHTSRLVKE